MMTRRSKDQDRWVYGFSLEERVPEDHLLWKIKKAIDFDFIYPLVEKHYSHTGAPSVDPVVVFKLSLVGYLYNIPSERRLLEEASLNMAYLWFLDYDIDEALPDHSIMTKARVRFGPDAYREFFHRVVEVCIEAGLVEGETLFLDSTLIDSASSVKDLRSKALVDELSSATERFVRELFEEEAGEEEHPFGKDLEPPAGVPKKANERFANPVDPDADLVRRHPGDGRLCYKGHFGVDGGEARIITSVWATGGATADEHVLLPLLTEHETLAGKPREVVADQKYGANTNFRILKARKIRPFIKPSAGRSPGVGFPKERFIYDTAKDIFICPNGKHLARAKDLPRWKSYRSKKADCASCLLKEACCPKKKRKTLLKGRNDAIFSWARESLNTPRGKVLYAKRSIWPETIFAEAKSFHGMAKARFRGRWKVEIQLLMTAAAMNLERLGRFTPKGKSSNTKSITRFGLALIAA